MREPEQFLVKLVEAGWAYIWFLLLAIWGGTVNYITRIKGGKIKAFSFVELIGEWSISGFAGVLAAFICVEFELSWHMTAFLTGLAGHQGGRAIHFFENYVRSKFPGVEKNLETRIKQDDDDV